MTKPLSWALAGALALGLTISCATTTQIVPPALEFSVTSLRKDVRILSSDYYEGRGPASRGEVRTLKYLQERFTALGLSPSIDGDYLQAVPLEEVTSFPSYLRMGNKELRNLEEFVAWSPLAKPKAPAQVMNSELVFVGFGANAPEHQRNGYEGMSMKGKTALMLINDPGFYMRDPDWFEGKAMTYYGRWDYKFAEAGRQGADMAIIVHETDPASYPWGTVRSSWTGPQFSLPASPDDKRVNVESWISVDAAKELFAKAGLDYEEQKRKALERDFSPVSLGVKVSSQVRNIRRATESFNAIAQITGTEAPNEIVLITAHWDHLGINPVISGDTIYNGAFDNASGTAGLLELARVLSEAGPHRRTIVFAAVAAEEQGLLGSRFLAENAPWDNSQIVGMINMDGLNIIGPTKDVELVGHGQSTMDKLVEKYAQIQGRTVKPDTNPESGGFFRSDQLHFVRDGVPAVYMRFGTEHAEKDAAYVHNFMEEYRTKRYHRPSDEYDPGWRFDGMALDLEILGNVIYELANSEQWPHWYKKSAFRAKRPNPGRLSTGSQ